MNFFSKNLAGTETLGDKLTHLRQEEGLSLIEVSQMTRIRLDYLSFLEKGQYDQLPGEVYVRNFLKQYAQALKVDPNKVLSLYDQEQMVYQKVKPNPVSYIAPKTVDSPPLIFSHRQIKKFLIALGVLALVIYLSFEIHGIISPPKLTVESPQDNLVTNQRTVIVSGWTEKESKIYINGEEILADASGRFEESLDLQTGINVIKISAKKKHGKESVILKNIRLEEGTGSSQTNQLSKIGQFNH